MNWYDPLINPLTAFFAGILAEAVLLLWGRWERGDWWKILACFAVTPVSFIGVQDKEDNPLLRLIIAAVLFCITFAMLFKKKILLTINKEVLLLWNAIFLYVYFKFAGGFGFAPLSWVILMCSSVVLLNAFVHLDKDRFFRSYLYAWFLMMTLAIGVIHFAYMSLAFFFGLGEGMTVAAGHMFLVGGAFLFLIVNAWYLVEILPLPGRHTTFQERLDEIEENLSELAEAYEHKQSHHVNIFVLVAGAGAVLALNYYTHLLPDLLLIPLLLLMGQFIGRRQIPLIVPPIRGTV